MIDVTYDMIHVIYYCLIVLILAGEACEEGSFGPGCNKPAPTTRLPQDFAPPTTFKPTTVRSSSSAITFFKTSRKPKTVVDTIFPSRNINPSDPQQPVLSEPQTFQPEPFEPLRVATPIYFQETNTQPIFNAETTTEVLQTTG